MTSTGKIERLEGEQGEELERLRAEVAAWRALYEAGAKRDIAFTNSAGTVQPLYTALDTAALDPSSDGMPGSYPFTRSQVFQ